VVDADVFLTTMASHVIYGLRRDVRKAKRLGQYTLEKKLVEGGMGVVYRARTRCCQRPTAVSSCSPTEREPEISSASRRRSVRRRA
jgi:hypothetical protein